MSPQVDVLLATYNNEAYLEPMLDSLLAQTLASFRLIVSDDCSQDTSVQILQRYQPLFEGRMELHMQPTPSGSAKGNYAVLMEMASADYVLFADADDIWDDDKVMRTVAALQEVETEHGGEVPAFVFSDVRLIDGAGGAIGDSYWDFKKIRPSIAQSLGGLLVCPPMLGCASGANAALVRCATPVPVSQVTGHDWWMILVASVFGQVSPMDGPTMNYRLHGSNSSDQKEVKLTSYAKTPGKMAAVRRGMHMRRLQARALIDHFGDELPGDARVRAETFIRTEQENFLRRRVTLVRGGYLYSDLPRNLAMLALA